MNLEVIQWCHGSEELLRFSVVLILKMNSKFFQKLNELPQLIYSNIYWKRIRFIGWNHCFSQPYNPVLGKIDPFLKGRGIWLGNVVIKHVYITINETAIGIDKLGDEIKITQEIVKLNKEQNQSLSHKGSTAYT